MLLEKYISSPKTDELSAVLNETQTGPCRIQGLNTSLAACYIAALHAKNKQAHFIILPEKEEAAYFYNDLQQLIQPEKVHFYPSSSHRLIKNERLTINALDRTMVINELGRRNFSDIVVTYPRALFEYTVNSKSAKKQSIQIQQGEEMDMDLLIEHLNDKHFERTDFVYQPGQFSWRGGIIDVFSFTSEKPIRIEFFGDHIESIREFDIEEQLSGRTFAKAEITPDLSLNEESDQLLIFDNLPKNTSIWMKNAAFSVEKIKSLSEDKELLESADSIAKYDELLTAMERFKLFEFGQNFWKSPDKNISISCNPQPSFNKNFELLADDLTDHHGQNYLNVVTAADSNQVNRFYEIFEDIGKDARLQPIINSFHEGFVDHDNKILCYTDHQIFGRYHKFKLRDSFDKKTEQISLKELKGLSPGDFITHIDHGVGKYSGLEKIDVSGKQQEAIRIIYKNNDVLYVNVHSLHRISKYIGKDGTEPKLDRLGSNSWKKLKQKTKKRVKELAFDLIRLYAERKTKEGLAFSPDSYLQTELEASFIYEDTPDQLKATIDVKKDMEEPHPMDRLVCGDVGFGKTEIAIRAAFKAVNDSKQVVILVPTTILAMQHYKTFTSRLKGFPCNIDYLNRFRTAKDEKRILEELENGKIDIIIGTHKLLTDKIKYRDLGLMVIDEEQKFGVGAKDKIKTIKVNVDTLTLTATPIPRTLQFSMMGARDLSIINTAPPNRQPIETKLLEFNEGLIKEAIDYEVARGGQVFFIHNRIQNIGEIGALIEKLCPDVKTLVAHGQMKGSELEKKMLAFIDGKFDVLISTTIVESGLDIPNANTIIINQANFFGLSDLHQMRGRVGRSNKKAFCILLSPPPSTLTAQAKKRLSAIEQFSDLGSGFHIAMRDLDIRGAGDLFGAEQSGFISEMGFDMYQKILQEAIQELKETEFKDAFKDQVKQEFVKDCQIETDLEILIPDDYVSNIAERLSLYRELDELNEEEALKHFKFKMQDRFGPIPESVQSLFEVIELRWKAKLLGMEKIIIKKDLMIAYFPTSQDSPFYQSPVFQLVLNFVQKNPTRCSMVEKNEKLSLRIPSTSSVLQARDILEEIMPEILVNEA